MRRRAEIDLSAFSLNLQHAIGDQADVVFDARADGYGHGAAALVLRALELGVATAWVSPSQEDLPGVPRSRLTTMRPSHRVVADEAYGVLPGGAPVMTLRGEVITVKEVPAGSGVSYGYSYRTAAETTLALIALGYADGIPRLASNRASVWIGGVLRPLVGRVAMDQLVVDCGDLRPSVGDDAVIFGDPAKGHASLASWAELSERAPLQLTANLGWRVQRWSR